MRLFIAFVLLFFSSYSSAERPTLPTGGGQATSGIVTILQGFLDFITGPVVLFVIFIIALGVAWAASTDPKNPIVAAILKYLFWALFALFIYGILKNIHSAVLG